MLKTLAQLLAVLLRQPSKLHYIGGSDILPPPLKGEEEKAALAALEQMVADCGGYIERAQSSASSSAICVWSSISRGALKTPA